MAKQYVFTPADGSTKDQVIGGYQFIGGKHVRNHVDGPLIEKVLVRYYACKLEIVDVKVVEEPTTGSLAKADTTGSGPKTSTTTANESAANLSTTSVSATNLTAANLTATNVSAANLTAAAGKA